MIMTTDGMTPADLSAVMGRNSDGMFGGDGAWWIIILFLFAFCGGWGNNGGIGGGSSVRDMYTLNSDFATIQRQLSDGFNGIDNALDRQNAGICDLGYTQQSLINNLGMSVMSGFNATQNAIADCCCKTQQNIKDTQYAIATTGADIRSQMQSCCCDIEKQNMQTNYNMAQQNCATLQAIDKVGDRIIDYLNADKTQSLRDENQALRLQASQQAQNNYLVNTLTAQIAPRPIPAFSVPAPYQFGVGNNCPYNN